MAFADSGYGCHHRPEQGRGHGFRTCTRMNKAVKHPDSTVPAKRPTCLPGPLRFKGFGVPSPTAVQPSILCSSTSVQSATRPAPSPFLSPARLQSPLLSRRAHPTQPSSPRSLALHPCLTAHTLFKPLPLKGTLPACSGACPPAGYEFSSVPVALHGHALHRVSTMLLLSLSR